MLLSVTIPSAQIKQKYLFKKKEWTETLLFFNIKNIL